MMCGLQRMLRTFQWAMAASAAWVLSAQAVVPRITPPLPSSVLLPGQMVAPNRAKGAASGAHRTCSACHKGHKGAAGMGMGGTAKAGRRDRSNAPDQICLSCHEGPYLAGNPNAAPKLPPAGGEGSGHLKGRFSTRKAEGYVRTVRVGASLIRLSQECSGCHDPHGKERGRLRSTAFDTRGQVIERRTQFVADICFGCHAGTEAAPLSTSDSDLGRFFTRGVASGHGIGATAAGRPELPSLRTSAFQGRLDCVSCHDNPDPSGARGPHSSPHASLLKAPFGREKDLPKLGGRANDLCYLCHDRQSIASNQSFAFHNQHLTGFTQAGAGTANRQGASLSAAAAVLGLRSPKDLRPGRSGAYLPGYGEPATCATCHASHGSLRQAALIEFDKSVVSSSSVGSATFQQSGLGHGTCTLTCHGYDHVQTRY